MTDNSDIRLSLNNALANKRDTRNSNAGEKRLDKASISAEAERNEIDGRKKFFSLRQNWSCIIIIWISFLIIFNVSLTVCVGRSWLSFTSDKWFLRLIASETFLQIVGMGYIAVRFLFSSGK